MYGFTVTGAMMLCFGGRHGAEVEIKGVNYFADRYRQIGAGRHRKSRNAGESRFAEYIVSSKFYRNFVKIKKQPLVERLLFSDVRHVARGSHIAWHRPLRNMLCPSTGTMWRQRLTLSLSLTLCSTLKCG